MTPEKKISKLKLDTERLTALRPNEADIDSISKGEKALVLGVAYLMAIGLWFMVNMDRDFNLNLNLSVSHGTLPDGQALVEPLPDQINVSFSGVGWKLLNLYNSPPRLNIDLESSQVDVLSTVRDQMGLYQDVSVIRVQPQFLDVQLEPKISKKVPIIPDLNISFISQFDFVGPYRMIPDSVVLAGARSLIQPLSGWSTKNLRLDNVRESIEVTLTMSDIPSIMEISHTEALLVGTVSEFTEGEVRIPVRSRNMPRGRDINFSPIAVTVRYDVPIEQYVAAQETVPYSAYVSYSQIMRDTTGVVMPQIEQTAENLYLRIRSVQPRMISYYRVVED